MLYDHTIIIKKLIFIAEPLLVCEKSVLVGTRTNTNKLYLLNYVFIFQNSI